MTDSSAAAFYTRYAALYDRIATDAPFAAGLRERVVDALDPARGEVVVEMGCGTGSNLPLLRERVGAAGAVIGVDFSAGVVARARDRVALAGWDNVHVVRGDATAPPVAFADLPRDAAPAGEVDGVLVTFVTGMIDDPARAVDRWCRVVGAGGRVCVAGFARSTHPVGRVGNPLFAAGVRLGTPPGRGRGRPESPVELLDRRALAAHRRVHARCADATTTRRLLGFARITSGSVDDPPRPGGPAGAAPGEESPDGHTPY
ncbi:methyltransferase domain-containing protein [Halorubrum sp. JWXQ-INN 858]|uniref:class I SAM-dependent methyltransferase n=1 Tax=Halorubrum sp. JWXQ-INN 858 TaxID=2690782 RepID=UPI00135786C9|nr:methyltransferase domain-containing protein [Halorubrum sp. JWXQ-INN 858]MWV65808.1 methyltransferase domain-containing protein [Halorubrum sp. JWXQ-INN 858]